MAAIERYRKDTTDHSEHVCQWWIEHFSRLVIDNVVAAAARSEKMRDHVVMAEKHTLWFASGACNDELGTEP